MNYELLKKRIKELGFRKNFIAGEIGVTKGYLSSIISGKRKPSARVYKLLAQFLDLTEEQIRG